MQETFSGMFTITVALPQNHPARIIPIIFRTCVRFIHAEYSFAFVTFALLTRTIVRQFTRMLISHESDRIIYVQTGTRRISDNDHALQQNSDMILALDH